MSEDQKGFQSWPWASIPRPPYRHLLQSKTPDAGPRDLIDCAVFECLREIALAVLPAIISREYGGQHRDSPTDAARIAFEYAEAFQAEAKRRAKG